MVYTATLRAPLFGLRREIDRLFDDAFNGASPQTAEAWSPAVSVRESDKDYRFEVELPGVKPDQVDVMSENGVLSIRGEKQHVRKEGDEGRYHVVERTFGSFSRTFQLPQHVNAEAISATFENGVLTVTVPKAEIAKPKRIAIKGGEGK